MPDEIPAPRPSVAGLSPAARRRVLIVALLGWGFSGVHMAITQLVGQVAMVDLLDQAGKLDKVEYQRLNKKFAVDKKRASPGARTAAVLEVSPEQQEFNGRRALIGKWYAWFQCAFLFGAASGGLLLGWIGDRYGRARGMSISILVYSVMAGVAHFAGSPEQLIGCWYLACLGVGGMWPNGVAMLAEAWSGMSRAMVSGVMGTSANVGIFLMNTLANQVSFTVTVEDWRWTMLVGAAPMVLGIFSWLGVPESPRWLAFHRGASAGPATPPAKLGEVFGRQLLGTTLFGIAIATVPMMGGWGSANWMQPWASEAGDAADPPNPRLKAQVGQARAFTGMIGSLLGGWIATLIGRRTTFFLTSLGAFLVAEYTFSFLVPTDRWFLPCVGGLGFFSGIYYGWLPLCLPELFPTRTRSTGAGVSFNFGRIVTAITVLKVGAMMSYFEGDYARIGRTTSLIFALGMLLIFFAPDKRKEAVD